MRKLVHFGVAVLFACLIFGCSGDKEASRPSTDQSANVPAQTSADNSAQQEASPTTLASGAITWTAQDTRGQMRQATEWIGKRPTVINFWGTWCPPCRKEIPDLVKLYKEYEPKGVEIVGLAVKDQPTNVQVFANEAGMGWVMLMGTPDIADAYGGIQGVPTTIFLDKDGVEVTRFVGARSYEDFKPAFDAILRGYGDTQQPAGM